MRAFGDDVVRGHLGRPAGHARSRSHAELDRYRRPAGERGERLARRAERGGPCGVGGLHRREEHGHHGGDHDRTDDGARQRLTPGEATNGQHGDRDHRREDRDAGPQLEELERGGTLEDGEGVRRSSEFGIASAGGRRRGGGSRCGRGRRRTGRPSPRGRTGRERRRGRSGPGGQGRRRSSPRRRSPRTHTGSNPVGP